MPESRCLNRMPVYDLETGRVVGRVRRLIVDPDERKVVGLLLSTRVGKEALCLPFRDLHAIGDHAVTVRGTDCIGPLSEHPEMLETMRSRRRLYHAPVLTEGGRFLGDVDEFFVNPKHGRVESLLLSGGLIRDLFRGQASLPAHLVLTVGQDAVIVRDLAVAVLEQKRACADTANPQECQPGGRLGQAKAFRAPDDSPARSAGQRFRTWISAWRQRNPAAGTTRAAPDDSSPPRSAPGPALAPGTPSPAAAAGSAPSPAAPDRDGTVPAGRPLAAKPPVPPTDRSDPGPIPERDSG
ncbi:MAG: PRC-barrel domain-containing protein [Firmicutes bacterium]|nr:PRC-barrel domain-containing protein [Bacillota bacterium]